MGVFNANVDAARVAMDLPPAMEPARIKLGDIWTEAMARLAKNPEETKKFLEFVAGADNMGFLTDTFPARKSAMELPRFQDPILANFKAMLPFGRRVPPHKNWVQIVQAYFDGVQTILLEDATPQEGMDSAGEEIQGLLDQ